MFHRLVMSWRCVKKCGFLMVKQYWSRCAAFMLESLCVAWCGVVIYCFVDMVLFVIFKIYGL